MSPSPHRDGEGNRAVFIQARRLKMSPVGDEDPRVLTSLGMIEVRDEGPVLTQAGTAALNG